MKPSISTVFFLFAALLSCTPDNGPAGDDSRMATITLDPLAAATAPRQEKVIRGQVTTEPSYIPQKTGYTFAGWCTDREAQEPFDFESTVIDEDITLYASYSRDIVLKDKGKVARVTVQPFQGSPYQIRTTRI